MDSSGFVATKNSDQPIDAELHPPLARLLSRRFTLPLVIALVGLILQSIVAFQMSETSDEPVHVEYGIAILKGHPERDTAGLGFRFDSKMPVSVLNGLPRVAAKFLHNRGIALPLADRLSGFKAARIPTILAAFALALLVFVYADALYGRFAALAAELLFVLAPNIMAHSSLATTDLYSALAAVLFLYTFWRFLQKPGWKIALASAMSIAFAQLTKFSSAYLFVILVIFAFTIWLFGRISHKFLFRAGRQQAAMAAVLVAATSLVVINAGFLFNRTMTPLTGYTFLSSTLQHLQQIPVISKIPLPLPYPYIKGFDLMNYANEHGNTFDNIYMLGQVRGLALARSDGFALYYLVCYLFKEPLGMQLILLFSLLWIVRRRPLDEFLRNEGLLFLAAAIYLAALSFSNRTQIGIRHMLPVLVFFVILSGAAFADWQKASGRYRALLAVCLAWTTISIASYFPQMIPYFNELVPDRKMTYRVLADSNLDWGQNGAIVADFLKKNPDVILEPPAPVAGRILVGADLLAGVCPATADYWVRLNSLKPVAHVGYAALLFEVRDPGKMKVATVHDPACGS